MKTAFHRDAKDYLWKPVGSIQLDVRDVRYPNRVPRRFATFNTIVYNGMNSPLYLWSQDTGSPTDWRLVKLIPGTNGTPPTYGDPGLGAPLGAPDEMNLTASNRAVVPTVGELVITATLGTGQGNGNTLREVGLFMGNNQMFARQVHPDVPKTSSITVTYTWRIAITS